MACSPEDFNEEQSHGFQRQCFRNPSPQCGLLRYLSRLFFAFRLYIPGSAAFRNAEEKRNALLARRRQEKYI